MSGDDTQQVQNVIDQSETQSDSNKSQHNFDERVTSLVDNFGEQCEKLGINEVVLIAHVPNVNIPLVFMRGNVLQNAVMLASVLKPLKHDINEMLNV